MIDDSDASVAHGVIDTSPPAMPHPKASVVKLALDEFKRSAEITRDVRFQANLRLMRRQRLSSYTVSLLSLYVIALSLIPNILSLRHYQSQILLACSIVLAVFVIFTSLIDGAQNFYHQGELLHQCARRIADINRKAKNIDVDDIDPSQAKKELEQLQQDYQKALDECPTNHDNVDYYREMLIKPHLFTASYPKKFQWAFRTSLRVRVWVGTYLWLLMPGATAIAISFAVYHFVIAGAPPFSGG